MSAAERLGRREFICDSALAAAAVVVGMPGFGAAAEKKGAVGVEEVSPVEDLMREHGALNRILLIYEESLRRFRAGESLDPATLRQAATIVRDFIEHYHEKLEENYLFPKLKHAGRLVQTVAILAAQHEAGRRLTAVIIDGATGRHFGTPSDISRISSAMTRFIAMYRPHEAREDTLVFPEFKRLVSPAEYRRLGDEFEKQEHRLFGKAGFEGVLAEVAGLEKTLGINDLSKFTPTA